jgi:type IV pilus assembly protein PilQ
MKKSQRLLLLFLLFILSFLFFPFTFAQKTLIPLIKFKDADIRVVLQSIAEQAVKDNKKVNIVVSPNVEALITVNLENVDWQTALKVILTTYGYGYKWIGDNIILVASLEELKERDKAEREMQEVESPRVKVFKLKYIDGNDAKKAVEPLLSPLGKVSVLELTGQAGWEFGTDVTKRTRVKEGTVSRTKMLLVSDTPTKLEEIESLLERIDVMPKQVLIKSRIMEVNRDLLRDIGFDWGTGSQGAEDANLSYIDLSSKNSSATKTLGVHSLGDRGITPSAFGPKTTSLTTSNTGLKVAFRKLTGSEFETIIHALEEDARANTLSAPTILTLNNQEASILVGTKFPIVKTQTSTETNRIIGGELDYYQDIGIQLNVIPQISGEEEDFINMIVHPAITSSTETVKVSDGNTTLVEYPKIVSREAETQIIIRDGETIVIGGLLKDVKTKQEIGVPILSKLPLLGWLFRRNTYDTEKIDLLVFITAHIIKPGEGIPQEIIDTTPVTSHFERKKTAD